MKKLKLSATDKQKLVEEFTKSLDAYGNDVEELKIAFEKDMSETPKEKVTILFTPLAYLKSEALVKAFKGEVGWQGLMRQMSDNRFLVYDIIVYPQSVNGARTLDPTLTNDWYEKYADVIEDMRFQAHSHVDMSTTPSTTDTDNQRNVVRNTITGGFMLFQIWNKKGDINSFFYDIDNNLLYDRNDINIEIQADGEFETLKEFVDDARTQVEDMVFQPVVQPAKRQVEFAPLSNKIEPVTNAGYQWKPPAFWPLEKKERDPFYWRDGDGHEGWGDY